MRALQVGGVDGAESLVEGGAQDAFVDQVCHIVEQMMLRDHVSRLERRAREHQFPVDRHRLALEGRDREFRGIVDQAELALRRDEIRDRLVVLVGEGEARDQATGGTFSFSICSFIGLE